MLTPDQFIQMPLIGKLREKAHQEPPLSRARFYSRLPLYALAATPVLVGVAILMSQQLAMVTPWKASSIVPPLSVALVSLGGWFAERVIRAIPRTLDIRLGSASSSSGHH